MVSAALDGETSRFVNSNPPLVERANLTPPVEVTYTNPTLSRNPSRPIPGSEIRVPGGQMQPIWSAGVAATVRRRKLTPPSTDFDTTRPAGI